MIDEDDVHRNYVNITRKKSDTCTTTKIDIVPRCHWLRETCVTERAIVDIIVEKKKRPNKNVKSFETLKIKDMSTNSLTMTPSHCVKDLQSLGNQTTSNSSDSELQRQMYSNKCTKKSENTGETGENPVDTVNNLLKRLRKKLKGKPVWNEMLNAVEQELQSLLGSRLLIDVERGVLSNKEDSISANNACIRLEQEIQHLERTCLNLKQERDASNKLAIIKSMELVGSSDRLAEADRLLNTANSRLEQLSMKLDKYPISIENLVGQIEKLQRNNQELKRLELQARNLSDSLKTLSEENRKLLTELQIATTERDQLQSAFAEAASSPATFIINDSRSRDCSLSSERTPSPSSGRIILQADSLKQETGVSDSPADLRLVTPKIMDDLKLKIGGIFSEMDQLSEEVLRGTSRQVDMGVALKADHSVSSRQCNTDRLQSSVDFNFKTNFDSPPLLK